MNCGHCLKHFINVKGKFITVNGCMHCVNAELKPYQIKRRMNNLEKCNLWIPMQIQIDKRKKLITEQLSRMAELIEDMAQILKEDNNSLQ